MKKMKTTQITDITLTDVGPIEQLVIPVPKDGGIVVLRGPNGVGKTLALNAVQSLLEGSKRGVSSRDDTPGATVEGLGARLTVGRRASRSGEVEVAHLDGEDPSLLVDPGLKDPGAADGARIAALCRLAHVEPTPEMFAPLLHGEDLRQLVRPDSLTRPSLPEMASAIKRDFEAHARAAESAAENAEGRAQGLLESIKGTDTSSPHDEAILAHDYETAAARAAELEGQAKHAMRIFTAAEEARATLVKAEADYAGPSSEVAEQALRDTLEYVRGIERAFAEANSKVTLRQREVVLAKEHDRQVQAAHEALAQVEAVQAPTAEDLRLAAHLVVMARHVQETGVLVRRALEQQEMARAAKAEAKAHRQRAEILRGAARGTEQVISAAIQRVAPRGLYVHEGRLVVDHLRGQIPFAELSHGERWRLALDVAIDAVGEGGLLVVRQEAWEGLDDENRQAVAAHARRRRSVILTAEASMDDLGAEVV